jgi:DNA replication and repair protein RecF
LLESLHLATQGFSPRTRHDGQLIRFGERAARVAVAGRHAGAPVEVSVTLRENQAKEARLNGVRLSSAEALRRELSALVFTPDRLAVVKGGPAARRAYFDRTLGRLFPARAAMPQDYLAALAQRNAALRRVQLGLSDRSAIEPWTEQLATLGAADLEARLGRDLERGSTGAGPHLDDVLVASGDRDLRQFGSQGEQRLAVLSLLLAEAELLAAPPLLLLDDVLSELDLGRRRVLAERIADMGQTVITSTHASALPVEPAQVVEVEAGTAR